MSRLYRPTPEVRFYNREPRDAVLAPEPANGGGAPRLKVFISYEARRVPGKNAADFAKNSGILSGNAANLAPTDSNYRSDDAE